MVVVIGKNVITRMNELESVKMVILPLLLSGLKVN
jgi:hypothetical protein